MPRAREPGNVDRPPFPPIQHVTPDLEPLVALLRERIPALVAAWVYGSAARGALRSDSDLDLAVLLPPGRDLGAEERLDLAARLRALAGRPVDLAVLARPGGAVLGKEVVTTGRRIHCANLLAAEEFEMYALSAYARLREDRAPVEAAYAAGSNG